MKTNKNLTELREELKSGNLSPRELLDETLSNISKSETNAFVGTFLGAEDWVEKLTKEGFDESRPLWGVPVALKDNILVKDEESTASSRILQGYRSPYSATVAKKLLEAGAVLVGRTNMDEFAMGSSTETSFYGPTKNPIDPTRVPGGSSGGSAAAVAEGLVPFALGTDTGGSIRQPAAFCGIVGFKPTYGAVSRYGAIAMGSSLDQVGAFARTVADAKVLFEAIAGRDQNDSTTVEVSREASSPKVIGVPRSLVDQDGIDPDVVENFYQAIDKLKSEGYEVKDIEIPNIERSLAVYYIIMPAEASSNLARFDGVRYGHRAEANDLLEMYEKSRGEGFGDEVRRRIMLGTYVLSSGFYDAYYNKAVVMRELISSSFRKAFSEVDVIATPTTPTPAFKIGEKTTDPLQMYLSDIFTVPANIAGLPAISIPSGTVEREGVDLPLGLQLMAPYGEDRSLFTIGEIFEKIK